MDSFMQQQFAYPNVYVNVNNYGVPPYNWPGQNGMPMAGENPMLGQFQHLQLQPPACQLMEQPQQPHDYHHPTHQWPTTPPAPAYHELTSSVKKETFTPPSVATCYVYANSPDENFPNGLPIHQNIYMNQDQEIDQNEHVEANVDEQLDENFAMQTPKAEPKRKRKRKQPLEQADKDPSLNSDAGAHIDFLEDRQPQMEKFCTVTGRLCVIGSQIDYPIMVDEIQRRAMKPEGLVRSHIGPLLKRGKVKGTGDALLKLLEPYAIDINEPSINRKRYPLTTLTALLEGESVQFSVDHREILKNNFPFTPLARMMVRTIGSPDKLRCAMVEAHGARQGVEAFMSVLTEWTAGGWVAGKERILASPMKTFAMATHALGVEECLLIANIYHRFLQCFEDELKAFYERVRMAAGGYPVNPHQFPAGIEPPAIPDSVRRMTDLIHEVNGATDSFAEISGRLTLHNKKYNVTVAEVMRRVALPESFNLSILGSYLKKGKTKDNCSALRDDLRERSIKLDQGRRKMAKNTTFTAMVEGEALDLAADMATEVNRTFPGKSTVHALVERSRGCTPNEVHNAKSGFGAASRLSISLRDLLLSLRLPVAERIPHIIRDEAHIIFNYCHLTHGYGPDAVVSWLGIFSDLFANTAEAFPRD